MSYNKVKMLLRCLFKVSNLYRMFERLLIDFSMYIDMPLFNYAIFK